MTLNKDIIPTPFPSLEKLTQARKYIHNSIIEVGQIPKVKFPNEEMDNIWDVSAESVEKRWEICYMNPCLGQTLLLINKLKQDFNPENLFLWIETLSYADSTISFHFFCEIKQEEITYIADFSHDNIIFLYKGIYKNRPKHSITSLNIQKVPAIYLQKSDSIFDIMNKLGKDVIGVNEEECRKLIKPHLNKLKKDNTDEQWQDFNTKRNLPPKIIIEGDILEQTQEELRDTLFSVQ